jgi:hypothetical protein
MKILIYFIILLTLACFSCKNNKTKNYNKVLTDTIYSQTDNCINLELYNFIDTYITKAKEHFMDMVIYYSIYFFKKDTIDYFTIWSGITEPIYYINENSIGKNIVLDYFNLKINNKDVFLIKQNTYNTDLFKPCIDVFDDCITKDTINGHYDGRLFIQTYKYNKVGNKFNIEKLEKPIVDFLGNLPERFW